MGDVALERLASAATRSGPGRGRADARALAKGIALPI